MPFLLRWLPVSALFFCWLFCGCAYSIVNALSLSSFYSVWVRVCVWCMPDTEMQSIQPQWDQGLNNSFFIIVPVKLNLVYGNHFVGYVRDRPMHLRLKSFIALVSSLLFVCSMQLFVLLCLSGRFRWLSLMLCIYPQDLQHSEIGLVFFFSFEWLKAAEYSLSVHVSYDRTTHMSLSLFSWHKRYSGCGDINSGVCYEFWVACSCPCTTTQRAR